MIRAILPRLLSHASDVLAAALYRITDAPDIARGLVVLCRERGEEIVHLRRHLDEARRIAHEQEDRADNAETGARLWQDSVGILIRVNADEKAKVATATDRAEVAEDRLSDARAEVASLTARLAYAEAKAPTADAQRLAREWATILDSPHVYPILNGGDRAQLRSFLLRLARVEVP